MNAILSVRFRDVSGRFTVNPSLVWFRVRDFRDIHKDTANGLRDEDAAEPAPGADRRGSSLDRSDRPKN
jgi:hypothetical protein